jgi:hypothetical protein
MTEYDYSHASPEGLAYMGKPPPDLFTGEAMPGGHTDSPTCPRCQAETDGGLAYMEAIDQSAEPRDRAYLDRVNE